MSSVTIMPSPYNTAQPAIPRRTEVGRLGEALDRLDRVLTEHTDRIEPILRPQPPMAMAGSDPRNQPTSQLATLVSRVDEIAERLARLTERVEA